MSRQALLKGHTPANLRSVFNANFIETYKIAGINVLEYGATGDGETDDTSAIQSAIDAAYDDRGIVVIPAGVYMIKATGDDVSGVTGGLLIDDSLFLLLDPNAELKAIPGAKSGSNIIRVQTIERVEICGGMMTGDFDGHTGTGEIGYCINATDSQNLYIHDTIFSKAAGDNIAIQRTSGGICKNIRIENCSFTDNRRWGIFADIDSDLTINGCRFYDMSPDLGYGGGIDIENHGIARPMNGIKITNCFFEGITENGGITLSAFDEYITNVIVSNNRVDDCAIGVNIRNNFKNIKIVNNGFNNTFLPIVLNGGEEGDDQLGSHCGVILGNDFYNETTEGIGIKIGDAEAIQYSLIDRLLISNNCFDNLTHGIFATLGELNFAMIHNNIFKDCTTPIELPVATGGSHIVTGNYVYDATLKTSTLIESYT
jgi:hypothetical protein